MAKQLNANDVANKWAQAMAGAGKAYSDGIDATSVNPMEKAADAADKWAAAVQQSYANGTFQSGLRKKTVSEWKTAAKQIGAARLASGAQGAKSKVQSFLAAYIPAVQSLQAQIQAMPNRTPEDAKARMNANFDGLKALKGKLN